jgi:hypothetical protein
MGSPFRTPLNQDALRARMERAIERLIAALDAMDAEAEDLEDEHEDGDNSDLEPSLGAPEPTFSVHEWTPGGVQYYGQMSVSQVVWCGGGGEDGDDNGIADEGGLQEYWRRLEGR